MASIKRIVYLRNYDYKILYNNYTEPTTTIKGRLYLYDQEADYQVVSTEVFSPINHTHSINDILDAPTVNNGSVSLFLNNNYLSSFTVNESNSKIFEITDTTYSIATSTKAGLMKPFYVNSNNLTFAGANGTSSSGSFVDYKLSGRYYPIGMDASGKLFVNVPWSTSNLSYFSNYLRGSSNTNLSQTYTVINNSMKIFCTRINKTSFTYLSSPNRYCFDLTYPATISTYRHIFVSVMGSNTYNEIGVVPVVLNETSTGCRISVVNRMTYNPFSGVFVLVIGK